MNHVLLVFLCLIVFSPGRSSATNDHSDIGSDALFEVMNSYPDSYNRDQQHFWNVLNRSRQSAIACSSDKAAKDFLSLVDTKILGSDLEEFISEGVETLCVKSPNCFQRVTSSLDLETRLKILVKLSHPMFFDVGEMACMKEKTNKHKSWATRAPPL